MISRTYIFAISICLSLVANHALAIQQHTLAGELDDLLETTQLVLAQLQQPIRDVAETNHFGLIWAGVQGTTNITIAVRVLPIDEPRAQITVASDSPVDARLEQTVLDQIIATAKTKN